MKRFDLIFTAVRLPLDAFALISAAVVAYAIRLSPAFTELRRVNIGLDYGAYIHAAGIMLIPWLCMYAFTGLYHTIPHQKLSSEMHRIVNGATAGLAITALVIFLRGELFNSRFIVIAVWLLAILFTLSARLLLRIAQYILYAHRIGLHHVVIIGDDATAQTLKADYRQYAKFGIKVTESFPLWNKKTMTSLESLIKRRAIQGIIYTNPTSADSALEALTFCTENHLSFRYTADLFAVSAPLREISVAGTTPIIEIKRTPLDGWGRIGKRLFDILFAIIILTITSPLFILISLAIFIETRGPIFFNNERVGEHGKLFSVYKFRTMYAEHSIGKQFKDSSKALKLEQQLIAKQSKKGAIYKITNDPRITPLGRFLRAFSLDELPNFFNVLTGDMSVVGPRPHQAREVAAYKPHHRVVFAIKPGITGLSQISGRSNLTADQELALDTFYLEHWSLTTDLFIIVKTPFIVLLRKGSIT